LQSPPLAVRPGRVSFGDRPGAGNRDITYMLARDALCPWRMTLENAELGCKMRGVNGVFEVIFLLC
jgi:ABC-type nitrate/sulfonate/bicarbonate transport system ATPase subunit